MILSSHPTTLFIFGNMSSGSFVRAEGGPILYMHPGSSEHFVRLLCSLPWLTDEQRRCLVPGTVNYGKGDSQSVSPDYLRAAVVRYLGFSDLH